MDKMINDEYHKAMCELSEDYIKIKKENKELKDEIENLKPIHKSMIERIQHLEKDPDKDREYNLNMNIREKNRLYKENEKLKEDNRKTIEKYELEIERLQERLAEKNHEDNSIEEYIADATLTLTDEIDELGNENYQLKNDLEETEKIIKKLQDKINELEEKIIDDTDCEIEIDNKEIETIKKMEEVEKQFEEDLKNEKIPHSCGVKAPLRDSDEENEEESEEEEDTWTCLYCGNDFPDSHYCISERCRKNDDDKIYIDHPECEYKGLVCGSCEFFGEQMCYKCRPINGGPKMLGYDDTDEEISNEEIETIKRMEEVEEEIRNMR